MTDPIAQTADPHPATKPASLARRVRLREFQSQLLERMQAARSGAVTGRSHLGVIIGRQRWLLDLKSAGEIVQVTGITPVPLTRSWFLGLVNIRGNLVSIIDFSAYQGGEPLAIDKDSRIVTLASGLAPNSGLLVSRVMGLRDTESMQPAPEQEGVLPWQTGAYIDRNGERWGGLDLSRIVRDPQFLHIGA